MIVDIPPYYHCPFCNAVSYNPHDILNGYCGRCHRFASDDPITAGAAAYHNDSYPERACDRCKRPYRGPAVYCSLACALADA